jgi:hypothetical protein
LQLKPASTLLFLLHATSSVTPPASTLISFAYMVLLGFLSLTVNLPSLQLPLAPVVTSFTVDAATYTRLAYSS